MSIVRKQKELSKFQIGLGILSIASFLGSLVFLAMGLLIPIRPHEWNNFTQIDDECVEFVFVSCMLNILLLSISWITALFGKFMFAKKRRFKFVLLSIFVVCLMRIFYVLPFPKAYKNTVRQYGEIVNSTGLQTVANATADYFGGIIGGGINETVKESFNSKGSISIHMDNPKFIAPPDATQVQRQFDSGSFPKTQLEIRRK
jgi:hypothetical protein